MDACRIARAREAFGGGVLSVRMALRAALFQSVTTSAHNELAAPSRQRVLSSAFVFMWMDASVLLSTRVARAVRRFAPHSSRVGSSCPDWHSGVNKASAREHDRARIVGGVRDRAMGLAIQMKTQD